MVCLWSHYHRRSRIFSADSRRLHHRHASHDCSCDLHVKYVVRLQVSTRLRIALQHNDLTNVSSILYKTKLPFILVFNKTDVQPHEFAIEWMQDFEAFQAALASHSGTTDEEGEPTYMNSLMNSMSLVLDEFYKHLTVRSSAYDFHMVPLTRFSQAVGVSSMTGAGIKEFFDAVEASRTEYEKCVPVLPHIPSLGVPPYVIATAPMLTARPREYLPELQRARKAKEEQLAAVKQESMARMMKDLELDRAAHPEAAARDRWEAADEEDEDADEDLDINIIDRSAFFPPRCVRVRTDEAWRRRGAVARAVYRCHEGAPAGRRGCQLAASGIKCASRAMCVLTANV